MDAESLRSTTSDRRVHPRQACELKDVTGQVVRNLSLGGAFLESRYSYSPDQLLELRFQQASPLGGIRLEGRVVRSETRNGSVRHYYGVAFDPPDPSDLKRLSHYLLQGEKTTAQPLAVIPRELQYRQVRYGPDFLKGLEAQGVVEVGEERVEGTTQDLSRFGACLVLELPLKLPLSGSVKSLQLLLEGKEIYRGHATLRHYRKSADGFHYGFEFADGSMKMDRVFAIREVARFERNLAEGKERLEKTRLISPEFKLAVSELRGLLDYLKDHLEREQKTLGQFTAGLQKMVEGEFLEVVDSGFRRKVHDWISVMEEIFRKLTASERPLYIEYCRDTLLPYLHNAQFIQRAYQKPLGYPGDFETMRLMYNERYAGDTLWKKTVNSLFWTLATPQAVRNRALYLAQTIKDTVADKPSSQKNIMSIACGPCQEILLVLNDHSDPLAACDTVSFHLVDHDHHALGYLHDALREVNVRRTKKVDLQTYGINVKDLIGNREVRSKFPPQDLIYSAGLFDYLNDEVAELLIAALYPLLRPGGRLVIGNFSPFNPFRLTQEFGLDWFLNYRDERALKKLVPSPLKCDNLFVEEEPTHINLFLNVTRAADEGPD